MMTRLLLALLALTAAARAQEWRDYRGPAFDGCAPPGAKVPLRFSEQENLKWKRRIPGQGWSSPVVLAGRVWLTTADTRGRKMSVLGVDLETGVVVVERVVFENRKVENKNRLNSYASPTAAVEPGRVYVHFGSYGTACLDARDGATIWKRRDIRCDHMEGPGSTPFLWNDLLIFHMDGGDVQFVIALDKETGKTRWKTGRSEDLTELIPDKRKAYSTPILIEVAGQERLICSGAVATMALAPKTGKELWKVRHGGFSMSSRPLHADGMLFLNTGFMRPQLLAVKAAGAGDVTGEEGAIAWTYRRGVPTMSSACLVGGRIYMVSDGGIATCLDAAKGEALWRKRIGGNYSASPLHVGGRIYFFARDQGKVVVLKAGDRFEKLAENQLGDGFMASPAVVGNALVLRSKRHLYRVEE